MPGKTTMKHVARLPMKPIIDEMFGNNMAKRVVKVTHIVESRKSNVYKTLHVMI